MDYLELTFKTKQFSGKSGGFFYGWETLEFDSFSIEWTAGAWVSSIRYGKPTATSGGTTPTPSTTNFPDRFRRCCSGWG